MAIRHSIVTICYNQEQFIAAALDSVLGERVKPWEIIVGDDASSDGTAEILAHYKARYPEIIKVISHPVNLGIFGNLNAITPLARGDVIHFLSGDDWWKPNLLENMNTEIARRNLNPQKQCFMLLPHVVLHHPDGSETVVQNYARELARYSPAGAVLRDVVHTRQVGISRALFEKWPLFTEDAEQIGPWADRVQHVLFAQHIDEQIIIGCEGPVYQIGVGITSRVRGLVLEQSYHNALRALQKSVDDGCLRLSSVDRKFLRFHERAVALSLRYDWRALYQVLLSAVVLASASVIDLRRVTWGIYRAHRTLASRVFRGGVHALLHVRNGGLRHGIRGEDND